MTTVNSILLLPTQEHREALLGEAFPGCLPPRMWRNTYKDSDVNYPPGSWPTWGVLHGTLHGSVLHPYAALVLAHDGKVVREGRDRALYVLADHEGIDTAPGVTWEHGPIESDDEPTQGLICTLGTGRRVATWVGETWTHYRRSYWSDSRYVSQGSNSDVVVAALAEISWEHPLVAPWSLTTVCAARGLGPVILLDTNGREIHS